MNPEPTSGIKTWQWVVTVIVIIVLVIIGVMVVGNKGSSAPVATDSSANAQAPANAPVNRIVMSDQYPGNVVNIESVQSANGGWVVIKNDNNGQPGSVIGSAHLLSGINANIKVPLTAPTVDGGTYYAILYTGNNGTNFDPTAEQPLTDAHGIIMQVFHASASAGDNLKG